jgi:SET domain-containing protein
MGGHMALNMPESMYNAVKDSLPPLLEIVPYMKRNRNAALKTNAKPANTAENIYVWRKTVIGASNRVEIHESPVHGMGVFAKVELPDKTYLAPFHGVEMTNTDFAAKYGNDTSRTYALIRQHKMIDGKDVDNLSHYCNESNTPNVALRKRGLYTIRPITAGEELFLKYHKNYPRDYTL